MNKSEMITVFEEEMVTKKVLNVDDATGGKLCRNIAGQTPGYFEKSLMISAPA